MADWLTIFDSLGPPLVQASCQAAVVAAIILFLCMILRDRIAPRWRFALWALVLIRLMLPVLPSSPASLFRVLRWQPTATRALDNSIPAKQLPVEGIVEHSMKPAEQIGMSEVRHTTQSDVARLSNALLPESPASITSVQPDAIRWTGWKFAGLIWVGGIFLLSGRLGLQILSLRRRQQSWQAVTDPDLLSILNHCRRQLGVSSRIALCIGPTESSPAVAGVWRPHIVIPEDLLTALTKEQLELVLLHELAHIRRRDIPIQWLLIAVRLVYWFNPAVWLAVSRMQAERELACDELVLDAVGAPRSRSYGETLLEIVKGSAQPMLTPGLLGAISTFGRLHRRIAMIRDYRKRSWRGTLAAVAILAGVAAIGLTDSPPATQGEEPQPADAKKAKDSPTRKLLDQLKALQGRPFREIQDEMFGAIRDLVKLGPDAVPELIEELDAAESDRPMRCIGFALRAIGDKRAVPALIRAIPKTCMKASSDVGARVDDPELMEFMKKHDTDEDDRSPDHFSFCRPVREISCALRKLTGQQLGEDELNFVFLDGSDRQQRMQRQLYQRVAQRWTEWWEANWKEQVKDEVFSKVNLHIRKDLENKIAFPHGSTTKFTEGCRGMILQSVRAPDVEAIGPFGTRVFLDLDTNRLTGLPERLRAPQGEPERMDEISAWAAREGFDVMATEYTVPGEDKPHYVLRSLGLTAWQIKTELWEKIAEELTKPEPPTLGTPAAGLLAHFDEKKGQYDPKEFATFLFVTREGGYGAMFVGAEVTSTAVDYSKPSPISEDFERSSVGVGRGRKLSYRLVEDPAK